MATDRGGYIHLYRAIRSHWLWSDPAQLRAFLWLVMEAQWGDRPRRQLVSGTLIETHRGQLIGASRFLATEWRWSEAKVRRFLSRLETDAMVTRDVTHNVTVITICNYDLYNTSRQDADAESDAPTDAKATQDRRIRDASATQLKEGKASKAGKQGKKKAGEIELEELPESIRTETMHAAWMAWARFRREKRAPLTDSTVQSLLAEMAQMGEARAIAAIQHTIKKGWQGLREPDAYAKPSTANARTYTGGPQNPDKWDNLPL